MWNKYMKRLGVIVKQKEKNKKTCKEVLDKAVYIVNVCKIPVCKVSL